jgi:hypothetical protein
MHPKKRCSLPASPRPHSGLSKTIYAAEPFGTWVRPSTGTQVGFYDCGGKLCAKIVAVKDQARKKSAP